MKRLLLLAVLVCLNITIALAQVTTDSRVNNASVISAPNGIIVIDIAKPDSNGLSNNTYTDFNIPTEGVVFNNNFSQGRSRLAGIISSNSNYSLGDAAHLILNQVTSNNSSSLGGFGEVFGSNAGVIIANPNGITCSGCGFINASRVDLVTGTSQFDSNNNLTGFSINRDGKVRIIGKGFNGSEVNYLNLVSRYHDIQAQITAQTRLRILSGNQTYNSNNFTITSNTNTGSGFAVDISALANLQSDSIVIIGTEAGLGINSQGNLISIMQNVEIDSAGRIILNKITSSRDIVLKSTSEITTTVDSYLKAGGDVNIDATGISLNSVLAYGDFTASTDGNFAILDSLNGFDVLGDTIVHSYNFDNSGDIDTNSLNVVTSNNFSNYKNIYTSALDITSNNFLNEGSISANIISVLARDAFDNSSSSSIDSSLLAIATDNFNNQNNATIDSYYFLLTINKDFTSNNNTLNGVNFNYLGLTVSGDFNNHTDITVDSLIITAQNFYNFAKLRANELTIETYASDYSDTDNQETITAKDLYFKSNNFHNNRDFLGFNFKNLFITTTHDFYNDALISADNLQLTVKNNFYNYKGASINSDEIGLSVHKNLNNYGDISANTAALVAGEKFTNSADGNIYSNELNIIASKNYNYGNIQASTLNIRADYLDNTGDIRANHLNILVYERFYNKDQASISASTLDIEAEWLENNASILSNTLGIQADRFVNNGNITADYLDVEADFFYNYKNIHTNSSRFIVEWNFDNSGDIQGNELSFRVADDFNNKGNIHFNSIYLLANDFYNSANASISAKYLALDVYGFNENGGNFDNSGDIRAEDLYIIANNFNNYSSIYSNFFDATANFFTNQDNANIKTQNFQLFSVLVDNSGDISVDNFNATVLSDFTNNSNGNIDASSFSVIYQDANVENNFINLGSIHSNRLDVLVKNGFTNSGDTGIIAQTISITAYRFANNFASISADSLDLIINYDFSNSGKIDASNLNLVANYFFNDATINVNYFDSTIDSYFYNGGNIQAYDLNLLSSSDHNYGIISAANLDIIATDIYNYTTGDIQAKNLSLTTRNDLHTSGDIQAHNLILTIENDFYNSGNIITDSSTASYDNFSNTGTIDIGPFSQTIPSIVVPTINLAPINTVNIPTIANISISTPTIPINSFDSVNFNTVATQDLGYNYITLDPNSRIFTIQTLLENTNYILESRPEFYEFDAIDVSGDETDITTDSDKNITIIHIARPDANGLSNNTYESFHIPSYGVVFNNNHTLTGPSVLVGSVTVNKKYKSGDVATIILNQITSNNRTYLEGVGEISGPSAALIIANPNGITCSGCGFINASRVDLITGTSNFNLSGELVGFGISNNGTISIGDNYVAEDGKVIKRSGLDGASIDNLNLVSRYHNIQSSIRTKEEINIFSGNNSYDYVNAIIDSTTTIVNDNSRDFAVDISSFSNLYSYSISLINTEVGLGTYSEGHLISTSGDTNIYSVGNLYLTDITSNQDIKIKTQAGLTTNSNSDFRAKRNISVEATGIFLNSILAYEDFIASTDGNFTNNGNLKAKNFEITADTATLGDIVAENQFNLRTQLTNLVGNLSVSEDSNIFTENYNQTGELRANENINITVSDTASFDTSAFLYGKYFTFDGLNLFNAGTILGSTLDISVTNNFQNNDGTINFNNFYLKTENFLNQNNANIQGSTLDIFVTNNFQNNNATIGANQLVANLFNFSNQGKRAVIGANNLSLTVTNDFENKENAMITGNNLSIATSTLDNDASITAISYSATADNFINQGKIIVGGDFNLSIEENTINNKEIHTGGNLNITTQNFINTDLVRAGNSNSNIDIQTTGYFLNQRGSIYSYGDILLTAGDFTNEGGWIESNGDNKTLEIHSNSILNKPFGDVTFDRFERDQYHGYWVFEESTDYADLEKNRGRIYSGSNMKLIAEKAINNNYSYIRAKNLTISGDSFSNPSYVTLKSSVIESEDHYRDACGFIKEFSWDGVTFRFQCERVYTRTTYSQNEPEPIATVDSIINIGNNVVGTLAYLFDNGTIQKKSTPNENNPASNDIAPVVENSFSNQTISIDSLALSSNPLFTIALSSDGKNYTIESRTLFTRPEEFVGSDHFCNQVGFCPPDIAKDQFASAEFQRIFLEEQFTRLGATAYLEDGNLSYADMFDALSQNVYEVARELNLEFGKPLSPDQIALLKKDIVWFEELQINGKPVLNENGEPILVPKLYLSKLTGKKIDADGSIFSASKIDINIQGDKTKKLNEKEKKEFNQDIIDRILSVRENEDNPLSLNESELDLKNQLTDDQRAELKELTGEKLKTAEDEFTQARDNKIQALKDEIKEYEDESIYGNAEEIQARLNEIITELQGAKFNSENFKKLVEKTYLASLNARGKFVNSGTFRASDGFSVRAGDINNHGRLQSGRGGIALIGSRDVNIESLAYEKNDTYSVDEDVKVDFLTRLLEKRENHTNIYRNSQIYGGVYANASIESEGGIFIQAGRDYNQIGASVRTNGQDFVVFANGNIKIDDLAVRNRIVNRQKYHEVEEESTVYQHSSINLGEGNFTAVAGGNVEARSYNNFSRGNVIALGGTTFILNPQADKHSRTEPQHDEPNSFNSINDFRDYLSGSGEEGDKVSHSSSNNPRNNTDNDPRNSHTTIADYLYLEGNRGIAIGANMKIGELEYFSQNGFLELLTILKYNTNSVQEHNAGQLYIKDKGSGNTELIQDPLLLDIGKINENSFAQGTVIHLGQKEERQCEKETKSDETISLEYPLGRHTREEVCNWVWIETKEDAKNRLSSTDYVEQFKAAAYNSSSSFGFNFVKEFNQDLSYNNSTVSPGFQAYNKIVLTIVLTPYLGPVGAAAVASATTYAGTNILNGIFRNGSDLGGFHAPSFFTAIGEGTWTGLEETIRDPNFYQSVGAETAKAGLLETVIGENPDGGEKKDTIIRDQPGWQDKTQSWFDKNFYQDSYLQSGVDWGKDLYRDSYLESGVNWGKGNWDSWGKRHWDSWGKYTKMGTYDLWSEKKGYEEMFDTPNIRPKFPNLYDYINNYDHSQTQYPYNNELNVKDYLRSIGILPPEDL